MTIREGKGIDKPDDPEGFVIPDLATLYVEIDRKNELSEDDKRREWEDAEREFQVKSERVHTVSQLLKSIRFIRERQAVCSAKFKGYDCR